jgi:GAF domain-containing protein
MTYRRSIGPTDAFAEIGRIPFREVPLDEVLTRIADLAGHTVPGTGGVSVTLLGPGGAHTAAFTGRNALILDEWQYEHGHGPCLAAAAANITVSVADIAGEGRWPDWADQAIEIGTHSSLSVGLPLRGSFTGALNLYSAVPHAFDEDSVILAQTFAGYAAVAMADAPRPAPGL